MRIAFVLPGFHRYDRGAETALIALAAELARNGDTVTLIGSGDARPDVPYAFIRTPSARRERFERFPKFPLLRGETSYEEASFMPGLWRHYHPSDYDISVTCSYPFTNWILRAKTTKGQRPAHIFVTQNGDWPARSQDAEYAYFGCDGLVCSNPEYFDKNRSNWRSALIPNGIDTTLFCPGPAQRDRFGIPDGRKTVLMVSALIPSKRVAAGVEAVARIPDAHLVVAGDGPLREEIDALAKSLLPDRFTRVSVPARDMPMLYRSCDAFLHLSKEESFGNVFLEAIACGLPVIAHDTPRVRWIVGDEEFLTDTEEPQAVADAITRGWSDRPALVEKRVARAAEFAWPIIARRYREFFAEVLAARKLESSQRR